VLRQADESKETQLNRATALLESGQADAAERFFLSVRSSRPGWLPGLRGLGRVQQAQGRGEVFTTASRILAHADATSRDFQWAGNLYLDAGRLLDAAAAFRGAVEREPDLYLAWVSLGDALVSMGRSADAVSAWTRAAGLCATGDVLMRLARETLASGQRAAGLVRLQEVLDAPGGEMFRQEAALLAPETAFRLDPSPHGRLPASTLRAGEVLRFSVSYLSLGLGRVVFSNLGLQDAGGRQVHGLRMTARSSPAIFFYRVRNEYRSAVTDLGAVVRHANTADDSTSKPSMVTYEMDYDKGVCVWRYAEDGLIGVERLPLVPMVQDGVSTLVLAREVARTGRPASVLTAISGTWKGTDMRAAGIERISWRGRHVEAIRVDIGMRYRGTAGLSGVSSTWYSTDSRTLPYRSQFKLPIGSVILELESE